MKKTYFPTGLLPVACISFLVFTSCVKDRITHTFKLYTPVYKTLTQVRQSIKSGSPVTVTNTGKICVTGHYIFLNEVNKGVHVIDNTNPAHPKNVSFINIPGNVDIAVKGNILYADSYGDLVTFDISNPLNAVAKKFLSGAFPDYGGYYSSSTNTDSILVLIEWTTRDTTVNYLPNTYTIYPNCANCAYYNAGGVSNPAAASNPGTVGTNGSTARFSIIDNYLYAVGSVNLTTFDISNGFEPALDNSLQVDWHVETIYPFKGRLFVGTNNGVYMYDITSSPGTPSLVGQFTHIRGCDPVIADTNYAYVTLNDGTACLGFSNELQIVNIRDIGNSSVVKSYDFTHPEGLSKDGNLLFICDGKAGLKICNIADVTNLQVTKRIGGIEAHDVIAENGLAIVLTTDGLYQYDYSNTNDIHLLSKL